VARKSFSLSAQVRYSCVWSQGSAIYACDATWWRDCLPLPPNSQAAPVAGKLRRRRPLPALTSRHAAQKADERCRQGRGGKVLRHSQAQRDSFRVSCQAAELKIVASSIALAHPPVRRWTICLQLWLASRRRSLRFRPLAQIFVVARRPAPSLLFGHKRTSLLRR
jgi:hypothetical protein